jgi:uncharacterized membrane protein YoaK (UPF0700 family)
MPSPRNDWTRRRPLLVGLTAAAGWLDALAWIHLGKVFLSFMSGNLLFLGVAAGDATWELFARAAVALAAFMLATYAGAWLTGSRLAPASRTLSMERTLQLEAAILALFALVWIAGRDPADDDALSVALIAIGAIAMGLQVAVALAWHVPNVVTVAMTGTLAQLAALGGWMRREGPGPAVAAAPPGALLVTVILVYLVAATVVAAVPATPVMALGPAVLVIAALVIDARSARAGAGRETATRRADRVARSGQR